MANVKPFRGIRYNTAKIDGNLSEVTTPPYDQINAVGIEAYHQKHENSYIRLILARKTERDSDTENRYTRAHRTLQKWLHDGILVQDEAEAFYVYRQTFEVLGRTYTRTGLVSAVHFEDPEKGVILRHEKTLPKHVDDRLSLLRETHTQFESIFLLYDDPDKYITHQVDKSIAATPDLEVTDELGTRHQVWRLAAPSTVDDIRNFFADRVLLIADGHHRYQTTGLFYQETGQEENAWVLATLYAVDDPGIVILPTHRVVKNVPNFDAASLWAELASDFEIEPWSGDSESMVAEMRARAGRGHVLGVYEPSRGNAILTLRGEDRLGESEHHSREWMKLDVAVLHRLILEKILGISMEAVAREGNLEYFRWPKDAVGVVDSGDAQAVFFLNATRPTQVRDLATRGELMPQKSTDFYPKLLSGLVALPLRPEHVEAQLSSSVERAR